MKILIIILVLAVVIFIGQFYVRYYLAIEKSNKESTITDCTDNINESFKGEIYQINRFEYDSYMNKNFFLIKIKLADSLHSYINYQYVLEPYKEILTYARLGQKVIKVKGKNTFTLYLDSNKTKSFSVPSCKELKK